MVRPCRPGSSICRSIQILQCSSADLTARTSPATHLRRRAAPRAFRRHRRRACPGALFLALFSLATTSERPERFSFPPIDNLLHVKSYFVPPSPAPASSAFKRQQQLFSNISHALIHYLALFAIFRALHALAPQALAPPEASASNGRRAGGWRRHRVRRWGHSSVCHSARKYAERGAFHSSWIAIQGDWRCQRGGGGGGSPRRCEARAAL